MSKHISQSCFNMKIEQSEKVGIFDDDSQSQDHHVTLHVIKYV